MPINYNDYPKDWFTRIRPAVMSRAGEIRDAQGKITTEACCEQCGVTNHLVGYRTKAGGFISWKKIEDDLHNLGYDYFDDELKHHISKKTGAVKKATTIVLTVAHLDHDKHNEEVDIDRLRAWCQRCHLGYDLPMHMEKARKSREKKKGLQTLFSNGP